MSRKLRMVCPICIALVFLIVLGILSMKTVAVSDAQDVKNASVTFTVDSWSNNGVAAARAAQETSARQDAEETDLAVGDASMLPQEHGDSGYKLSEAERCAVESIVMCEAGGEGVRGEMMVAQCILDGMLRFDFSVDEYIDHYKVMSTSYSRVTDEVRDSVSRVFDNGERVTEEKADLWYNPAIVASAWHEEQRYVITVGSHRFFWMTEGEV